MSSPTPPTLTIASRTVGGSSPCFVIAEIGVNHDGRLDTALALVDAAAEAGADAVKLQLFRAHRLMHRSARLADYQRATGAADPTDLLRRYELSDADAARIVSAITAAGMVPLATGFSPEDLDVIAGLGLPAVKLASPDLVNALLIDRAASLGLPMLLSTGAAAADEVEWATDRLAARQARFALLHCVSAYPTPDSVANISRVGELAARHGVCVGYSDHTQQLFAGAVAVAAGAKIVEKHLTHDRNAPGPDHSSSADTYQFAEYVRQIRLAERLLGQGTAGFQAIENEVRQVSRQSLVARHDIAAGSAIHASDLTCQRPGTGLSTRYLDYVVGRTARRPIRAGQMLKAADIGLALAA